MIPHFLRFADLGWLIEDATKAELHLRANELSQRLCAEVDRMTTGGQWKTAGDGQKMTENASCWVETCLIFGKEDVEVGVITANPGC